MTFMICNIPKEIKPLEVVAQIHRLGFARKFDLLHIAGRGSSSRDRNYGYGFINMQSFTDAHAFKAAFSGLKFDDASNSENGISLRPARVQGYIETVRLLARSEEKHGLRGFVMGFL